MVRNQKGSALILVLVILSFALILGTSILTVTQGEVKLAKVYNDSSGAFYIAEAGIDRAVTVIENAARMRINNIHSIYESIAEGYVIDPGASEEELRVIEEEFRMRIYQDITTDLKDYFYSIGDPRRTSPRNYSQYVSFISDMDIYQNISTGTDTMEFTVKNNGIKSYYEVTASFDDRNNRTVKIQSVGHYGNSIKRLTASYFIEDTEHVEVKEEVGTYDDLNIFLKKAITAISRTSYNNIWNNAEIIGDVLMTCLNLEVKDNNDPFTGEFAIKTYETSPPGQVIYTPYGLSSGYLPYPGIPGFDTLESDVLRTDENGHKYIPDYFIKSITDFDESNYPTNHPEFNFILLPNGCTEKDELNIVDGKYNVIISNGPLSFPNKQNFRGLIYCTNQVEFKNKTTVEGMIIANNIITTKNKFSITYEAPSNEAYLTELINIISSKVKGDLKLEIKPDPYAARLIDWREN